MLIVDYKKNKSVVSIFRLFSIMIDSPLQIGDFVELKERFNGHGKRAIVIKINRAESTGFAGWISFDYVVMTEREEIIHITENCIEKIHSRNIAF